MKHYYSIEIVTSELLDEEEVADLESAIQQQVAGYVGAYPKITTEYIDSEG